MNFSAASDIDTLFAVSDIDTLLVALSGLFVSPDAFSVQILMFFHSSTKHTRTQTHANTNKHEPKPCKARTHNMKICCMLVKPHTHIHTHTTHTHIHTNTYILIQKAENQRLRLMPERLESGMIKYFPYMNKEEPKDSDTRRHKEYSSEQWKELIKRWEHDYQLIPNEMHPETQGARNKETAKNPQTVRNNETVKHLPTVRNKRTASLKQHVWEAAKTIENWPKLNNRPVFKLDIFGNVISM